MSETARHEAKRRFWPTVTSDWRAVLWVAVCAIAAGATGAYFAWGHSRSGTASLTAGWAAAGLIFALITIFVVLWVSAGVSAPFREIRADLAVLSESVGQLEEKVAQLETSAPQPLRVALFAVRDELAACAIRIGEALGRQQWWDPEGDPLPASEWKAHFAALADPALPHALHQKIGRAYQHCDRLNHRISRYIREYRSMHFPMPITPAAFGLADEDAEELRATRKLIDDANAAIYAHLGSGEA